MLAAFTFEEPPHFRHIYAVKLDRGFCAKLRETEAGGGHVSVVLYCKLPIVNLV